MTKVLEKENNSNSPLECRIIILEHGYSRLENKVDKLSDKIDARFDKVDARSDKIDARFDKVDARFEKIDERIIKYFLLSCSLTIAGIIGLAGLMAKGFHWL